MISGTAMPCAVDGCPNKAKKARLCHGHYKRQQRGQTINQTLNRPKGGKPRPAAAIEAGREYRARSAAWELLTESALAYADCDATDDREFHYARWNLGYAARQYVASLPSLGADAGRAPFPSGRG